MEENDTKKAVIERKTPDHLAPSPKGVNYLFVIGIDNYQHCPKLYNCLNDANAFIDILTHQYDFEPEHVLSLFDEQATESNIYAGFKKLAQTVTDSDNVVIYFSGHGEYEAVFDEGYWIPVNAQLGAFEDYLPNSKIKIFLNGIASKHTFLIADSCFSGSLFTQYKSAEIASRLEMHPSRWGLTAGRNEVVSDGSVGDHSPFADSLLYHLKNNIEPLGVATLCQRVTEDVLTESDQTPIGETLKVKGHRGGQFFFHLKNEVEKGKTMEANSEIIPNESFTSKSTNPPPSREPSIKEATMTPEIPQADWENRPLKLSYNAQGKVGFVDASSGEVVIEKIYDKAFNFKEGVAFVRKNNKFALINKKGEIIIPFIINQPGTFRNGMADIMIGTRLIKINTQGETNYNGKLVKVMSDKL